MAKAVCFRWCVPRMLQELCPPPPKPRVAGVAVTAAARLSAEAWDKTRSARQNATSRSGDLKGSTLPTHARKHSLLKPLANMHRSMTTCFLPDRRKGSPWALVAVVQAPAPVHSMAGGGRCKRPCSWIEDPCAGARGPPRAPSSAPGGRSACKCSSPACWQLTPEPRLQTGRAGKDWRIIHVFMCRTLKENYPRQPSEAVIARLATAKHPAAAQAGRKDHLVLCECPSLHIAFTSDLPGYEPYRCLPACLHRRFWRP